MYKNIFPPHISLVKPHEWEWKHIGEFMQENLNCKDWVATSANTETGCHGWVRKSLYWTVTLTPFQKLQHPDDEELTP